MTIIEICNTALARVGVNQFIDSLEEDTAEARTCKVLWPNVRESALASFPWPFATRRQVLTDLELVYTNWQFAYSLPADFLVSQRIESGLGRFVATHNRPAYSLESHTDGTQIMVADVEDAELLYTSNMSDATQFPPLFSDALSWMLAKELSMALAVRLDIKDRASKEAEVALSRAIAVLGGQSHDVMPESEFITVRG